MDHDDIKNHGNIATVHVRADCNNVTTKPKIGIMCAPDRADSTAIGIPYVEMEPTDEGLQRRADGVHWRFEAILHLHVLPKFTQLTSGGSLARSVYIGSLVASRL